MNLSHAQHYLSICPKHHKEEDCQSQSKHRTKHRDASQEWWIRQEDQELKDSPLILHWGGKGQQASEASMVYIVTV